VAELRQVEVVTGYGKSCAEVVKTIVVTENPHFRRRVEHGGLRTERVKRLEEVELENT
jgi:putative transposase